jgi:hypothetical protein
MAPRPTSTRINPSLPDEPLPNTLGHLLQHRGSVSTHPPSENGISYSPFSSTGGSPIPWPAGHVDEQNFRQRTFGLNAAVGPDDYHERIRAIATKAVPKTLEDAALAAVNLAPGDESATDSLLRYLAPLYPAIAPVLLAKKIHMFFHPKGARDEVGDLHARAAQFSKQMLKLSKEKASGDVKPPKPVTGPYEILSNSSNMPSKITTLAVRAPKVAMARKPIKALVRKGTPGATKTRVVAKMAPVAKGYTVGHQAYSFSGSPSLKIRHSEFLGDVVSAGTAFSASSFCTIQPGDPVGFPWLSAFAGRFEQYRVTRLVARYLPSCSTATAGTVIVAFDTNAQRATPTSKVAMLDYSDSFRDAPWTAGACQCTGIGRRLFTQFGNNYGQTANLNNQAVNSATLADVKTYASGQLLVATDGVSAGTIGEIWLDYEVELMNPGVFQIPGVMLSVATAPSSASNMITPATAVSRGNLALVTITNTTVAYELPPGTYAISMVVSVTSTDTGTMVPSGNGVVNLAGLNYGLSSATGLTINNFFQVTIGTLVTITWSGFSHLNTSAGMTFRLMPYDGLAFS